MTQQTCKSCKRTFKTYALTNGKCRICKRKEDNAYDLDMLTNEEYQAIMGEEQPKQTKGKKKKPKNNMSEEERVKQTFLNLIKDFSQDEREEILNNLK